MKTFYLFLILLFFSFQANAGVSMVSTENISGSPTKTTIMLDGIGMRAETAGAGNLVVIFRRDKAVMWIINNNDKTYMELDKATLTGLTTKMTAAMKLMQEKMAKMPAEQRKQMEAAMKENNIPLPGEAPQKTIYTKTARKEAVDIWQADIYEGTKNGVKVNEIWTIDPSLSGIGATEIGVISEYVQFVKSFLKDMNLGAFTDLVGPGVVSDGGYAGFPVKTILFENGKEKGQTTITEIKKGDFSPSSFDLPAGYTKAQANPMGDLEM